MGVVNLLVEGSIDEAVGRRLVSFHGAHPGVTYGKQGFGYIKQKVGGFAQASAGVPMLTLVDFMDTALPCPSEVVQQWVPHRPATMLFRVVVPEIECWVMADRQAIASYLSVRINRVPLDPESLGDPKQELINLARQSRRRDVRQGMVPRSAGASTGPLYNSMMVQFVQDHWDPAAAIQTSPSLERAGSAVADLVATL